VFQESPGFGVGPGDGGELWFFLLEKPIHGGWRYGQELPSHLLGENQFLMLFQLFDHPRKCGSKSFPTGTVKDEPDLF